MKLAVACIRITEGNSGAPLQLKVASKWQSLVSLLRVGVVVLFIVISIAVADSALLSVAIR